MSLNPVICSKCFKPVLFLWCRDDSGLCESCVTAIPVSTLELYKLLVSPISNNGLWSVNPDIDFKDVRIFVEECLRPLKAKQYQNLLTSQSASIRGLVAVLETFLPPPRDLSDSVVAKQIADFDRKVFNIETELSASRKQFNLLRKASRRMSLNSKISALQKQMTNLEWQKHEFILGGYDEAATIRKHSVDRIKKDLSLFASGLLEMEEIRHTHRVHWELLKPTGDSWEELLRHYSRLERITNHRYDLQRLKILYDIRPISGQTIFMWERLHSRDMSCLYSNVVKSLH